MLSRLQSLVDEHRSDLLIELEEADYDDLGTASVDDIWKAMKLAGLFPDSWD